MKINSYLYATLVLIIGIFASILFSCKRNQSTKLEINNLNSSSLINQYEPQRPYFTFEIYDEESMNQYLSYQKTGIAKNEISISLKDKRLQEFFFKNFKQHSKITYLRLIYFQCSYSIINFERFEKLKDLEISNSIIDNSKELFYQLSSLNNLKSICLFDNLESKNLDSSIGKLGQIIYFSISNDSIKTIPNEIGNMKNLNYLRLNCSLETLPDSLVNLQKLTVLNLKHNSFKKFPEVILGIKNLEELNIEDTEIDYIPDEIVCLKKLKKVKIDQTNMIKKMAEASFIKSQLTRISDSSNIKFIFQQEGRPK
jgi:Leucine-rich repeat (LRR) protein